MFVKQRSFHYSLEVQFRDIDMLGHTNNATYFSYLEEARIEWLKALGYEAKDFQTKCPVVVAHAACDYKSPSYLNEVLTLSLTIPEIKKASFTIAYDIREQKTNRLVAEAKTVLVTFDHLKKKVIPIPDALRAKLKEMSLN